jgi:predicted ATPase
MGEQARYVFKHALIQDTAYQSLLKSTRQQYHQQIARVMEEQFPDMKEQQPELLARHYTEANLIEQAIPYWQQAGERAAQRSAHAEAIGHLTQGLECVLRLPDTPARAQQELRLQVALGKPLMATKGYGAPEVERVYSRARDLCRQETETAELFPVLLGLWVFHLLRAELRVAHELGARLLRLAQDVQDPVFLLEAHFTLGGTLFWLGELRAAQAHLAQGLALYEPHQHGVHVALYGQDLGVGCRRYEAWTLWVLGYPEQALTRSQQTLALAREVAHPFSLGYALWHTTLLEQLCRNAQAAQQQAEALIGLASEQGFAMILAYGPGVRGWALAQQGREEEGLQQIHQSLAAARATGEELVRPYSLALLAEVYGKNGQAKEGLAGIAEALELVDKTGERWGEAELYRLKGELTLTSQVDNHQSPVKQAEECFLTAIEVARKQQAKSWELRASTSLARLWQQQGKTKEAHGMLAVVYAWFTEGFDTKDLQEARALLEELE